MERVGKAEVDENESLITKPTRAVSKAALENLPNHKERQHSTVISKGNNPISRHSDHASHHSDTPKTNGAFLRGPDRKAVKTRVVRGGPGEPPSLSAGGSMGQVAVGGHQGPVRRRYRPRHHHRSRQKSIISRDVKTTVSSLPHSPSRLHRLPKEKPQGIIICVAVSHPVEYNTFCQTMTG